MARSAVEDQGALNGLCYHGVGKGDFGVGAVLVLRVSQYVDSLLRHCYDPRIANKAPFLGVGNFDDVH